MRSIVTLDVNQKQVKVVTDPERSLLDVLREDLHLCGTKYGCGEGQCGACTVLVDDKRVFSCQTPISKVEGRRVLTIEGLASGDKLHPVQEAFLAEYAFQCGYCTPGMIMNAVALLKEKPAATPTEIRSWMNRNLCRCCGYSNIVKAVELAAGAKGAAR